MVNLNLFDKSVGDKTQTEQVLEAIRTKRGVTNYELAAISLKYSSRISELRKDGYDIRAERVWKDGRATGTFRYYEGDPNA